MQNTKGNGYLTQEQWVENILIKRGSITRNFCLRNYVSRLSAYIAKLEKKGYIFETGYIETQTPFGTGRDYEYRVKSKPDDILLHMGVLRGEERPIKKDSNESEHKQLTLPYC